jgi:hypothetical protein
MLTLRIFERPIPYYSKGEALKNQGKVALGLSSEGPYVAIYEWWLPHGSSEEG